MRILHLLGVGRVPREPEHDPIPGVPRVALELARRQVDRGHRVTVAAPDGASWTAEWRGVELRGVGILSMARIRLGRKWFDLRAWVPTALLTRRHRFDVVHAHEATRFRHLAARARVAHLHTDPRWDDSDESLAAQLPEFRRIQRDTGAQVAVSGFVSRRLREGMDAAGIPREAARIEVVRNGVDLDRFPPARLGLERRRLRNLWGVGENDLVLLFAAAVVPKKGMAPLAHAFLDIMEELPQVHLTIAGGAGLWESAAPTSSSVGTPFEEELRVLLRPGEAAGRVRWLGIVPGSELPGVHAATDVLVQPSVFQEAFGLSILEGMAAGNPVLATTVGGIPELVDEGNGILVPPGDVTALADAIRRIARHPRLLSTLAQGARKTARRFNWDEPALQIEALYQSLLES